MAEDIGKVLDEIKKCSQAFNNVNALFNMFYAITKPSDWISYAVNIGLSVFTGSVMDWITALRGDAQYNACVVTAAANWKSKIVLDLLGIG